MNVNTEKQNLYKEAVRTKVHLQLKVNNKILGQC
jgi:hypothetical protein